LERARSQEPAEAAGGPEVLSGRRPRHPLPPGDMAEQSQLSGMGGQREERRALVLQHNLEI